MLGTFGQFNFEISLFSAQVILLEIDAGGDSDFIVFF
jgi:hypothetical protein